MSSFISHYRIRTIRITLGSIQKKGEKTSAAGMEEKSGQEEGSPFPI